MLTCYWQRAVRRKVITGSNPGDRQVVPAATFLGDRLNEVGLASFQTDRRRSVDLPTCVVVDNHPVAALPKLAKTRCHF